MARSPSRSPSRTARPSRSRASSGEITEDAYYEEIADLLRTMPSDWRRQYRSGRDKLAAIGGPMLPDTPSPEQVMLLIGITAGGNPSGDTPFGPHRVPRAVREAAMKGIRLSHANNYGAWDFIGLARAIELVIVPSVSDTTFKRMGKYLFRHKKDASAPGFGDDANPSRGYMAWLNWGGDPAVSWTRAFERNPHLRRNGTFGKRYTHHVYEGDYTWDVLSDVTDPQQVRVGAGEEYAEVWGTPGTTFWTEEAVEALFKEQPQIGEAFGNTDVLDEAVHDALKKSWEAGGVARRLAPDRRGALYQLANRVPVARLFQLEKPFGVGYLPRSEWERGEGLQLRSRDNSAQEGEREVRPSQHRFRVGEPVYRMSSFSAWVPNAQNPDPLGYVTGEVVTSEGQLVVVTSPAGRDEMFSEQELHRYNDLPASIRRVVPPPAPTRPSSQPAPASVQPPPAAEKRVRPVRGVRYAQPLPEIVARVRKQVADAALAVAPTKVEALSEKSLKVKKGKLPARAIAVVTPVKDVNYELFVTLFDPGVMRRKRITGQDILGHASADIDRSGDATIGVAAAEPGYAYLLYATMATLLGEVALRRHGKRARPVLKGSYSQTKYAKRFWSRQPGGAVAPLSEEDFKAQFGTTYKTLTQRGVRLAKQVAKAENVVMEAAYRDLRRKGSDYFSDYYGVSSEASSVGPTLIPRPASPRETVEALQRQKGRRPVEQNLALVMLGEPTGASLPETYLVEVPRGASTLQPENILARVFGPDSAGTRDTTLFGQFRRDLSSGETYAQDIVTRLRTLFMAGESAENRRKHERMLLRGESLKAALKQAGFGGYDMDNFFSYLARAANVYAGRAQEIERDAPLLVANPRRFPLSVPIFMPV